MQPIVRQSGEGEQLCFAGGGLLTFKAAAAETGEAFALFEDSMVRGKTTPLHLHPNVDESIYLLEGELLAHLEGSEHEIREGGFVFIPRGKVHALLVTSERARILALLSPGSGEAFFRSASDPSTSAEDASRPADIPRLQAAAAEADSIEILGPPPF